MEWLAPSCCSSWPPLDRWWARTQPAREGRPMATIFTVDLTGMQEVPPNASAASGTGTVVWDAATTTATYEFVVNGLDFGPALGLPPKRRPRPTTSRPCTSTTLS